MLVGSCRPTEKPFQVVRATCVVLGCQAGAGGRYAATAMSESAALESLALHRETLHPYPAERTQ